MAAKLSRQVGTRIVYALDVRTGVLRVSKDGVTLEGRCVASTLRKVAPALAWASAQLQASDPGLVELRDKIVAAGLSVTVEGME